MHVPCWAGAPESAVVLLGRGTDEGTLSTPVGLVGGPPAWIACPAEAAGSSRPAARAATSARAAITDHKPPFPGREFCWGGSSIYWRTVPDEEKVAPSYSGLGVVLLAARRTTKQQLGRSSQAVSMPRVAGASGILGLERIVATRRAHPEVVVAANDRVTREALGLLREESLSVQRRARRGQTASSVHQHALLWHMYRVVESAALSETRDLEFGWPLLGLPDSCGVARPGLAPIESAGLAAFHRDRSALDAARRGRGRGAGRGTGGNEIEEVGDGAGRAAARAAAKAAAWAAEQARKQQQDVGKGGGGRGNAGAATASG